MNRAYLTILLSCFSAVLTFAQVTYQGPASGSINSGVVVSTDNFLRTTTINEPIERGTRNVVRPEFNPMIIDFDTPAPPEGSNYFEDPSVTTGATGQSVLLKNFMGINQGNSIPPDPHVAVGPTHIIGTVNTSFAIWDKEGNQVKLIQADSWYSSTLTNAGAFDPQVIYDHYAKRWFMLWDNQSDALSTAYFLISVSDDSIPLGTWYNYAIPAHWNGSTPTNLWGDYPGIGFDDQAIYINSRQFSFGNPAFYSYNRIRILNKAALYAANGGPISWTDIWNISYPHNGSKPDIIRPVINYSSSSPDFYMLHAPTGGANFMTVYKLSNPLTSPVLTGVNLPVTFYANPPDANQLGGSTVLISSNHAGIMHAPTFRDGFIWAVHAVWNNNAPGYSAISYVKINPSANTVLEDVSFGALGYWHLFPALAVDKDHNIAITYSRSGLDEYAGAFYTSRLNADPPGLSGSRLLRPGMGNYVVTFGGARNRWGDYHGMYIDPSDENNFWMLTEYAAATNNWGTWVGKIRLVPFEGIYTYKSADSLNFGNVEKTFTSDTLSLIVTNYGTDALIISAIPDSSGPFKLVSSHTFPITINGYDSVYVDFVFNPLTVGFYEEFYSITTNDPSFTSIALRGKGYEINEALGQTIYASTGLQNSGDVVTINEITGAGTLVGPSLFNDIKSAAIDPSTNILYGLSTGANSSRIVRINAALGDAYTLYQLPIGDLAAIAFDTTGNFYVFARTGQIYNYNLADGSYTLQATSPILLSSVAFHPETDELYASIFLAVGAERDRIYKINLLTGDTVRVGRTGLNVTTNALVFDEDGNLYGTTGTPAQVNNFVSIDPSTGVGTVIGPTGFKQITGLAYTATGLTSIDDEYQNIIPSEFQLSQNYPNPFNPATTIEFSLPKAADVKVVVYNLLGEVVTVVLNKQMNAGVHKTVWNSNDNSGKQVSSGVYFYELRANSGDGNEFQQIRKMVLLK